jgi:DNA-binding NarL/FixJ family response regulator
MTIQLMLVDDHPIVRDGLRRQFESSTCAQFQVIGEAGNSEEAMLIAQKHKPTLALVDIALPGVDGIDLTCQLRCQNPALAVLMLSMYDDNDHLTRSVRAGASGYVFKGSPFAEIAAAARTVAAGGMHLGPTAASATKGQLEHPRLSPREREILDHIIRGYSNKKIAKTLNLSVRTVESHRDTIKRKLGAQGIVHLVKQAVRFGFARV